MTEEDLRMRVAQGLQKKKKCSLCLQYFYVDELPGAITYKSILELRAKWGVDVRRGNKLPSPSQLYRREELCTFCMQFFDVDAIPDADGHHGAASADAAGSTQGTATGSPTKRSAPAAAAASSSSHSNTAGRR